MPAQSIPPLVIITLGVAGMGALQYGVHWIFKPTKVASLTLAPHTRAAKAPPNVCAGHMLGRHAVHQQAGGRTERAAMTRARLCAAAAGCRGREKGGTGPSAPLGRDSYM